MASRNSEPDPADPADPADPGAAGPARAWGPGLGTGLGLGPRGPRAQGCVILLRMCINMGNTIIMGIIMGAIM